MSQNCFLHLGYFRFQLNLGVTESQFHYSHQHFLRAILDISESAQDLLLTLLLEITPENTDGDNMGCQESNSGLKS